MRFLPLFLALSSVSVSAVSTPIWAHDGVEHPETMPHIHPPAKSAPKAPADETTVDYFWRKSDEAFHAGDYPRAVGLHRAIVALDPTEIESWSVGSWLIWSLGKPAEAVEFIETGLKANPENSEMWDAAGQHFDLQKRFADSARSYARAVELGGKDADMMLRRRFAHASEGAGDLAKSLEVWRALARDFPADVVNKNNLARVEKAHTDAQGKNGAVAAVAAAALFGVLATGFSRKNARM